jgi:hypothetical protein
LPTARPKLSKSGKSGIFATVASLASLIAALSCCLPLGTLLMSAGAAGASLASESLRPVLLWLSAGCLGLAFVQTYFRSRCDFRYRRLRTLLLWFSAVVVVATVAAPRFTATLLAGQLPKFTTASELHPFSQDNFVREFDSAAGETRWVVLLSPT